MSTEIAKTKDPKHITLNPISFVLSDGRKVEISPGKTRDLMTVSRQIKSQEELVTMIISKLTKFDGKHLTPAEILKLHIPDYLSVIDNFNKLNPLSSANKSNPVTLSDGRQAEVIKGMGSDIVKASQLATYTEEITSVLVSLLTTVDGKRLTPDDVLDLPIHDYSSIMGVFQDVNPLSRRPS